MVRLFMKQEFVSMQDRIIVKNEKGNDVYLIAGKWGRLGDSLSLYTMGGELLVEAKQTLLSVFPTFDLYVRGKKIGTVVKRPGIKRPYYRVKKLGWLVTGNFLAQRYTIREKTNVVMRFEKAASFTGDFYSLDISDKKNAPLCSVLAVIIDHYSFHRPTNLRNLRLSGHQLGFYQPLLGFTFKKQKEENGTFQLIEKADSKKSCLL